MIIAFKKSHMNSFDILINEVKVDFIKYTGVEGNSSHKVTFDYDREYNRYIDQNYIINTVGVFEHFLTYELISKLNLSVKKVIKEGFEFNPSYRTLIDHINVLEEIKTLGNCSINAITYNQYFSKLKTEYTLHRYLDKLGVLEHLKEMKLIRDDQGIIALTELGEALINAKHIKRKTNNVEQELIGICKYCSTPTNYDICMPCRVKHTDFTMYEKSNRF